MLRTYPEMVTRESVAKNSLSGAFIVEVVQGLGRGSRAAAPNLQAAELGAAVTALLLCVPCGRGMMPFGLSTRQPVSRGPRSNQTVAIGRGIKRVLTALDAGQREALRRPEGRCWHVSCIRTDRVARK
jgi:hypothetical protein